VYEPSKQIPLNRRASGAYKKNRVPHENPFRNGECKLKPEVFHPTIARYPEFIMPQAPLSGREAAKPQKIDRIRNAATIMEERPAFYPSYARRSTPTPSVVTSFRNLRRPIPSTLNLTLKLRN